jgi:aspartate/methionine/tyrosine aminotransferase
MQNLFISAPAISQVAALAAFDATEDLEAIKAGYAANRALLLERLPQVGFPKLLPADGAFYVYADVSDRTDDSLAFCKRMLAETGIATTPGIDFDPALGNRFVRFSYAGILAEMDEAVDRLGSWRKQP